MAFRLLCAFALVLTAFAHRPTSATDIDLSRYLLPDGSLPVFCLPGSGDGEKTKPASTGCEFCRLVDSIAFIEPPAIPEGQLVGLADRICVANPPDQFAQVFSPHAPPTGPPA